MAPPRNSARSLRQDFCPNSKFGKRRNPVLYVFQRVKKASQSLPPAGGKGILIIFCRGVYLTENTTQAASVRFVRQKRTNRARGRLQSFCQKKAKPFFDSLESCMYFWFFKRKKWGKKTAETRRRNCAVVPYYLTLDMAERRLIIESLNNLRSQAYCSGTVYRRS